MIGHDFREQHKDSIIQKIGEDGKMEGKEGKKHSSSQVKICLFALRLLTCYPLMLLYMVGISDKQSMVMKFGFAILTICLIHLGQMVFETILDCIDSYVIL